VTHVEARDDNGFLRFEMDYPTRLEPHDSLRPRILAELSAKPPKLAPQARELPSFVAQFRGDEPEIAAIPCVDPVETAADKLSAFAWRVIARERGTEKDDPTIVRHVHDLAVLEAVAMADERFGPLLVEALVADTHRGSGAVADLPPRERLVALRERLEADEGYAATIAASSKRWRSPAQARCPPTKRRWRPCTVCAGCRTDGSAALERRSVVEATCRSVLDRPSLQ
jgi:hypothetical protein